MMAQNIHSTVELKRPEIPHTCGHAAHDRGGKIHNGPKATPDSFMQQNEIGTLPLTAYENKIKMD